MSKSPEGVSSVSESPGTLKGGEEGTNVAIFDVHHQGCDPRRGPAPTGTGSAGATGPSLPLLDVGRDPPLSPVAVRRPRPPRAAERGSRPLPDTQPGHLLWPLWVCTFWPVGPEALGTTPTAGCLGGGRGSRVSLLTGAAGGHAARGSGRPLVRPLPPRRQRLWWRKSGTEGAQPPTVEVQVAPPASTRPRSAKPPSAPTLDPLDSRRGHRSEVTRTKSTRPGRRGLDGGRRTSWT